MMMNSKNVAIIITAAGNSTRMGGSVKKEYMPLGNGTVLSKGVAAFVCASQHPKLGFNLSHLVITVPEDGSMGAVEAVSAFFSFQGDIQEKVHYVKGSETRQHSVYNAMTFLKDSEVKPDIVLIHDGARPFVSSRIIFDVISAAEQDGAGVPGIPVVDTIKEISPMGVVARHIPRKSLVAVQTPQGFDFSRLLYAHMQAITDGKEYTDDSEIFGEYCGIVKIVPGDVKNIKITYPGDLERGMNL
ncbi:MAG: 2-C-methyl-D-erythritol 4-phosphate cytidylyltransferase [Treponema sp.]|nr:2-C-methyl-D-erythritol 4-phosphate cytidylyltransferase [Treponema sp.]